MVAIDGAWSNNINVSMAAFAVDGPTCFRRTKSTLCWWLWYGGIQSAGMASARAVVLRLRCQAENSAGDVTTAGLTMNDGQTTDG